MILGLDLRSLPTSSSSSSSFSSARSPNPSSASALLLDRIPKPSQIRSCNAIVSSMVTTAAPSADSGFLFRRKLLYLENHLGISSSSAFSQNPDLRSFPLSSLKSITAVLRSSFGITHPRDAGRILSMHPSLLTCDPESDLLPVLDFLLHTLALPRSDVCKAVVRCPRLLVSSVEGQLRPTFYFLKRLGFFGTHRITCQTSLLLVSSVEATLIPKLDYVQSLGFSYKETVRMFLRSPGLFTFSIENNFMPKVEFLVGEMERDVNELKDFPQYFSFSLEKKIKPRHRLLLEHGFSMTLADMLKVSDGEFNDRLVEMRLRSVEC